jgi:hypothetical protein
VALCQLFAAGVHDAEEVALGVGQDHEAGVVGICPVDPGGPEGYQAFDFSLLFQGAVGVEVKVRPVVLVQWTATAVAG